MECENVKLFLRTPLTSNKVQKWSKVAQNPVTLWREAGFCILWSRLKHMGKDIVFKMGISQQSQQRPGESLPNLRLDSENWKVRLVEKEFMKRMWDVEGV